MCVCLRERESERKRERERERERERTDRLTGKNNKVHFITEKVLPPLKYGEDWHSA